MPLPTDASPAAPPASPAPPAAPVAPPSPPAAPAAPASSDSVIDARMRNQAAAFPRLVHQLKTKDATIAQLREELKAFQESVPGKGKRPGGEAGPGEEGTKDWETAIDRLPE